MLSSLLNAFFGCSHRRTTFPLTPARRAGLQAAASTGRTYVVCLDCGRELVYDWDEMRVGEPVPARGSARPAESYSTVNR